jgi:hypothetical protein
MFGLVYERAKVGFGLCTSSIEVAEFSHYRPSFRHQFSKFRLEE